MLPLFTNCCSRDFYVYILCAIALKPFFSFICAFALKSFQVIALLYQERGKTINNTLSPYNLVRCQKDHDFTAKLEFHVRLLMCFGIVMDDSYQISGRILFFKSSNMPALICGKAYIFYYPKIILF